MKAFYIAISFMLVLPYQIISQETLETNPDKIYQSALEEYHNQNFEQSLNYTNRGLDIAPEYHDIRILQIRNLWALEDFIAADSDLGFLLKKAPDYIDVNPLVLQRINRFNDNQEALEFIHKMQQLYPEDAKLQVKKAQILFKDHQRSEARNLAQQLIKAKDLSGEDRYILQILLSRTVRNEIGVSYNYINFSEEYLNYQNWHTTSAEYQHNFNRTAVIGRINYSDREINSGSLVELEAYPVFNERFYAFTNLGFSNGAVFPEFRGSVSLHYNFLKILEGEVGGRILNFSGQSYFSGILGLSAYYEQFYFNARTFIGPERSGQLIQNYQFNVRYYLKDADNYLFARLGSGVSPDERTDYTQIQYPGLETYYLSAGINKTFGMNHIVQLSAGFLTENITEDLQGNQFLANFGYRYRF